MLLTICCNDQRMSVFNSLIIELSGALQRSLEDEINRTTAGDIPIFMISYAVIFLYIAVALGEYSSFKRILVSVLQSD